MDTSKLKLKLFREIDTLEKSKLEQVYDLVLKLIHTERGTKQWDTLSKAQQQGLLDAVEEMNHSEGVAHQSVASHTKIN